MLFPRLAAAVVLTLAAMAASAFDVQGHRGATGLAPENTLAGFERALAAGVSSVELDIGLTADDVVVITHDTRLNPAITRDASGRWLAAEGPRIRDLRYGQLIAFDVGRIDPASDYARRFPEQAPVDGARMPTLRQLFDRVRELGADHLRFNIETKISPLAPQDTASVEQMTDALLRVIHAAGMEKRVSIESFDWRTLRRVQQVEPGMPTAYLTMRGSPTVRLDDGIWTAGLRIGDFGGSVPRMIKAAGGTTWSPLYFNLTESEVQEAHALGLLVLPATVDDPQAMDRLIGWGVDGIITNRPDLLRAVLRRRGMPLPPAVGRSRIPAA